MNNEPILIQNESDFWAFITSLMEQQSTELNSETFEFPDVEFKGYPNLSFNVKGSSYSSTLTTPLLNALTALTSEIQKSYCLLKYRTSNLQRLTLEDKQEIDIIFKIKDGSSNGDSNNENIANGAFSVIKEGMSGMNGFQKLVVLIAFMGILGGLTYKWLDNQSSEGTTQATLIDHAITALESSNTQTLALLKNNGRSEIADEIETHTRQGKNAFMKEIAKDKNATNVDLNQATADRTQLDEYKKRSSVIRKKTPRIDDFIIKGVELYAPQYIETDIIFSVIRVSDDMEFKLKTSLDLINDEEMATLKSALGTADYVKINYEEIKENGKVVKSQFVRIEK